MFLRDLKVGNRAIVKAVGGEGALRQHFLDMGIIPGVEVKLVKLAPMGDPMELTIHGYELTLRLADAQQIEIEECKPENSAASEIVADFSRLNDKSKKERKSERKSENDKEPGIGSKSKPAYKPIPHPGLGEDGKFHCKRDENPLPEGTVLTYALVGNQNCGKTTLFNQLTGSNQHVGNFPGVTVDRKDGQIRNHANTKVTDLPGIYSMSPYTAEEIVSRNFVLNEKPKAIINILDATNIERNLYLTMQLLELGIPMVVALNMMDEVKNNNGSIDVNLMEAMLGVPVIPISAAKNHGVDELVNHAIHVAHYQETPLRQDFCDENDNEGAIHRGIHAIIHLIADHADKAGIPVRFAASKLVEGDDLILEKLELDDNEKDMLEHIIVQLEKERGLDRSAAMADMRFSYIMKVCDATVIKPVESKEHQRSKKIDKVLTGKFTAIPCFILIMCTVFFLTFNVIGAFLQGLIEKFIEWLTAVTDAGLTSAGVNSTLHSLIIDGIFAGVGSVLSFLPIIVIMFFFLSMLEDSGYIARVAFFMDKLLRKIGLSGRSIVPLLIGFGCSVPAIMSTRTLPSKRDRRMTILLTPFMSCSAKLPIYAFFVNAFFPKKGGFIMAGLYLVGIVVGILVALIYKKTLFKGEAVPFVMELPNYRLPGAKNVMHLLWEKAKDFLQKAFSIILIATIVVWFLQNFDFRFNLTADPSMSIIARLSSFMEPVFSPAGLGDWRICTSFITGFVAKESVVSTMQILFDGDITTIMTQASAASMLVFSLIYTPCVAAIAAIKRELGAKWAVMVVLWQCILAWILAVIVYQIAILL